MFSFTFDKTMEEVKKEVDKGNKIILVDVREKDEYIQGHLPNAFMIPLSTIENSAKRLPKDQPLYVYCRSGQRSRTAVKKLKAAGYDTVYNIGGVLHWNYALETGEEHV